MNKFFLFIVFTFAAITASFAQTKSLPQLSFGGEFGFPTGKASQVYGSVLGGSAKLELPVQASKVSVVFTTGYSFFLTKFNYSGNFKSALYVPAEAGARWNFSKIGYAEGDLGVSANIHGNYSAEKAALVYSPVIGFSAPTSKHKATIDVGLRYEDRVESGGSIGQVALRLAYRFGLK